MLHRVQHRHGWLDREGEYDDDGWLADRWLTIMLLLQGLLTSTSHTVSTALDHQLWPAQFTVVVPAHWSQESCSQQIRQAKGQTRYQVHRARLWHRSGSRNHISRPRIWWWRQTLSSAGVHHEFISQEDVGRLVTLSPYLSSL